MKESKSNLIIMLLWLIVGQTTDTKWFAILAFLMAIIYVVLTVLSKTINE